MKAIRPAVFTWSGGKDSALALHKVLAGKETEVCALLTTVTEDYGRVSMHGVRETLLRRQAAVVGIPLRTVRITKDASNGQYEEKMRRVLADFKESGIHHVIYGDICLDGIREYREKNLEKLEMKALFPLWGSDTGSLAERFIDLGFRAITTCVDSKQLDKTFCGREYDRSFLHDLPESVDPCGENGEFHTFVYDGPLFGE
ncbi:MAG: diphthine--ammonia ligase, partial [Spirochaetes bacterium]|nr:diphthine--ammonia ligase [Spirochaetota bacterium]